MVADVASWNPNSAKRRVEETAEDGGSKSPKLSDSMVASWNPNSAKRRVEETAEDDGSKSRKQAKRPRQQESDGYVVDDGSADGSVDGAPLVLQQLNEDNDWGYYGKGVSNDDSSDSPSDSPSDFIDSDDDGHCGQCNDCVPNQVCKSCHYINCHPPGQEERYKPLKCLFCGKDGDDSKCVTVPFYKYFLEQKEKREQMKLMLSKGIDTGGSVESGNVPLPN